LGLLKLLEELVEHIDKIQQLLIKIGI